VFDFAARIDELAYFLATHFSMQDREALEILLSALLECPRTPSVWLVLESNWLQRNCESAWFAFGGEWTPRSLAELRSMRSRLANQTIRQWLDDAPQQGRLFVEPDFERLPRYQRLFESRFLLARSLRLRTLLPRSERVLAVDSREQDRRADSLAALVRHCLEDPIQARPPDPPIFRKPPNFAYHAELLQRLAPWYPDWDELLNALASLAVHHAHLFGKSEVDEQDWKILSRVAADSVPPWIHRMIHYLDQENSAAAAPSPAPAMSVVN